MVNKTARTMSVIAECDRCFLQSATSTESAIDTAKWYGYYKENKELRLNLATPEAQNLSVIIGRIVLHSVHFHLSVFNYVSRGTYRGRVEGVYSQQHVLFTH